jgi:serine/threonine protein kinase
VRIGGFGQVLKEGPGAARAFLERPAHSVDCDEISVVFRTITEKPSSHPDLPAGTLRQGTLGRLGRQAAAAMPPRLGRYQIVRLIAQGGMAEVYLAVHGELPGFRTPVVLKRVLPHLARAAEFTDMFLDEARIASRLDHPNVVRIYEVGHTGREYFLAMEVVQGQPLSSLLELAHGRGGHLDHRMAAFVLAQAAAGLHHAHELADSEGNPLHLVHRDISPQNLLVSFEGGVKVIDFGVARALGRLAQTRSGGQKGKLGYMSPEQVRSETIDARADIFALGVVLWECLCGRRLFQRPTDLGTTEAVLHEPISPPSAFVAVDGALEAIVMRALARDRDLRFATALEFSNELERYLLAAGGIGAADLSALMKESFAEDHASWQRTMRAAINTPLLDEPQASAPDALTATLPAVWLRPGRRSMVLGGSLLLAVIALLVWWRPHLGANAPADPPVAADTPPRAPPRSASAPAILPLATSNDGPPVPGAPTSAPARRRSEKARRAGRLSPASTQATRRLPNPF